jgi:hypothetical protein
MGILFCWETRILDEGGRELGAGARGYGTREVRVRVCESE